MTPKQWFQQHLQTEVENMKTSLVYLQYQKCTWNYLWLFTDCGL